jgi:hypothetical protein
MYIKNGAEGVTETSSNLLLKELHLLPYTGDGSIFQVGQNARYLNYSIFTLDEATVEFGAPERLTAFGTRTYLVFFSSKMNQYSQIFKFKVLQCTGTLCTGIPAN